VKPSPEGLKAAEEIFDDIREVADRGVCIERLAHWYDACKGERAVEPMCDCCGKNPQIAGGLCGRCWSLGHEGRAAIGFPPTGSHCPERDAPIQAD